MKLLTKAILFAVIASLAACAAPANRPDQLSAELSRGGSVLTTWVSYKGKPCIATKIEVRNLPDFSKVYSHSAKENQLIGTHKDQSTPEAQIMFAKIPSGPTQITLGCTYRTATETNDGSAEITTRSVNYFGYQKGLLTNLEIGLPKFVATEGQIIDLGRFDLIEIEDENCRRNCLRYEHYSSDDTRKKALARVLKENGLDGRLVEVVPGSTDISF